MVSSATLAESPTSIIIQNKEMDDVLPLLRGQVDLPIDEMKMINRVIHLDHTGGDFGKGHIVTELDLHPDLWFFKCHFPGDPVMPGSLGIECLWQSLGLYLALKNIPGKGRALGVGNLKFMGEITPAAKKVQFELHVNRFVHRNMAVALANGEVKVDGEILYTAEGVKAGIFPNATALSFPG